jgi:toxin YoeB
MKLVWTAAAWEEYLYWQENDQRFVRRVNELIRDIRRDRFRGVGKPEPLKFAQTGWWSRRVTGEHRLVYRVVGRGDAQQLEIASCRYHY